MNKPQRHIRLGVNIDHVATLRNARGGVHPEVLRAAIASKEAGVDGITMHLREDRRHVRDADIRAVREWNGLPLNFEMAATAEMLAIARQVKPHAACIVPERREELTTEGGLDVARHGLEIRRSVDGLQDVGIRVSLFIDPDPAQLSAAREIGADIVELHTGRYCELEGSARQAELKRLKDAARLAGELGLECHAGHGLNYENVGPVATLPQVVELNIGHFLIGEAVFRGLAPTLAEMRRIMDEAA